MKIFMVGLQTDMHGGISSAAKAYERSGFFERYEVRYFPSVHAGSGIAK